jgi:predicted transcriptional regulator
MKRNKLEIIKDILGIIKDNHNEIKPTPLIRKSNLSTARFNEYLNELSKKGFVKEKIDNKGNKTIQIQNKGFRYLEKYNSIIGFIQEFEL